MLKQDEFLKELRELGGIPDVVLENEELIEFFSPTLRADFEIAEKNGLENESPIKFPLFAMMGNEEKHSDKISNWGRYTNSKFNYEIMEGGHFFINKHHQMIAHKIKEFYEQSLVTLNKQIFK